MSENSYPEIKSIQWLGNTFQYIDQTRLPGSLTYIQTREYRDVIRAIKNMQIRGAPAIGIAAAYAVVLAAREGIQNNVNDFYSWIENTVTEIASARPTARNLFFALERIRKVVFTHNGCNPEELYTVIELEAHRIYDEDTILCTKIGEYGAKLLKEGDTVLTHCNTGMLVTAGIGTAFGVIITAFRQGKHIHIYADETRPLLQGSRLTAWECEKLGIPVTLICDSAAASLMRQNKISCVIVGADRIAKNGDVANKIGTYSLAVNCKAHNIPFYVAAPYSTFDVSLRSGEEITLEHRESKEVTECFGVTITPKTVSVYNPAFDITPAEYVTAFITNAGIYELPYGNWNNLFNVEK